MALATLGAFFLAIWTKSGDYVEGIAVMLFYQIGELFQSYAVGKSRQNISALMDIRPDYANIEAGRQARRRSIPDEVAVGSIIVVQPGEKVPLDGVIVEGSASLNTSALTGESLPRDVKDGRRDHQRLHRHDRRAEDPHDEGIRRVHRFEDPRSCGERQLPQVPFRGVHLPLCQGLYARRVRRGAGAGHRWCPLGRMPAVLTPNWTDWIYRALTFLVVSCPCALVISIPLSFFAGIGGASQEGILIKGSNYLEALSESKVVVFDKTGTLTQGVFEVTGVHHSPLARSGAAGIRRAGRVRLLAPHQQEPAEGLRQGDRPQPRDAISKRSAATASPPRSTATPSPQATAS